MELPLLPRKTEPQVHSDEVTTKVLSALSSPEPEVQRGRKRRRDPLPFTLITTSQTPSGETFRGRCRQRSTSLVNLSSRNTSRNFRDASYSPSRKRFFRVANLERRGGRRRSQSPSRSRSPDDREGGKRRRQRTTSHSRDHQGVVSFALVEQAQQSPLRLEFTTVPEVSRDKEQEG